MRIGNLWAQAFMRFADLQYADQIFFAEIELPKNTKFFSLQIKAYNALIQFVTKNLAKQTKNF
jgi:hypothetical protein